MKKKLLLVSLIVMALMCVFAISVSAATYDKTEKVTVALTGGSTQECALYDADGDELVWYTLDSGASVKSIKAKDVCYAVTGGYSSITNTKDLKALYLSDGTPLQLDGETRDNKIVVANFRGINFENVARDSYKPAFYGSTILQYIYLPSTIKSFACNVFQNCSNLKVCDIPSDASFTLSDSNIFPGCKSLVEINLMGCTKIVGSGHFSGCSALERCYMDPAKLANNCSLSGTFDSCKKLTQFGNVANTCIVPDGVTSLGNNTFKYNNFKVAILPDTIETMGYNIFDGNTALTTVNIPSALRSDGGRMFMGCTSLATVTGLENCQLTKIGLEMFKNTAVTEITFPNTVTSVGQSAFYGCNNLKTINLGAATNYFDGYDTLNSCTSLETIYMPAGITGGNLINTFRYSTAITTVYYVGSYDQLVAFCDLLAATSNNGSFTGLTKISWTDYQKLEDKSGKYAIYDYGKCDAFYNGVHGESETTYRFKGEAYTTDYCSYAGCARCKQTVETKLFGPLFENKGYSKVEDGSAFTYGIVINEKNIESYKARTNNDFVYGFIVGEVPANATGDIVNADGTTSLAKAVMVNFTDLQYEKLTVYNVRLFDLDDAQKEKPVYCGAYVIDGNAVSYVGNAVTDKAASISSKDILVIEPAN